MSQSQHDELETTIELLDKNGKVIETIVIPPDEMAYMENAAQELGVDTETFIREAIESMLERKIGEHVGS